MNTIFKAVLLATAVLSTPAVFAQDSGVAAGNDQVATSTANGSTATIVAVSVGVFAIIGAVVAGSASNGSSTATSTSTSTTR